MKTNKLIYVFLLAAMMGFSSQSFAILATMNAEGYVTGYTYSGDIDPFSGLINIGDAFTSSSGFDTEGADSNTSADIGAYSWRGDQFGSSATVGSINFSLANLTAIAIKNDYVVGSSNYDIYVLNSVAWVSDNERLMLTLYQRDNSAQAFSDDSLALEPAVDLFDISRFWITSYDATGNQNYSITGNLSSLVDPPLETASVPEPNSIFLLGLGLIAVFFASRKGGRAEAQLAV